MTSNIIADNLLSQIDEEGHYQLLLDEIIGHRKDEKAIQKEDGCITTSIGYRRSKMTTK